MSSDQGWRSFMQDVEIDCVWRRPKTRRAYWFLLNRYFALFGNIAITMLFALPPSPRVSQSHFTQDLNLHLSKRYDALAPQSFFHDLFPPQVAGLSFTFETYKSSSTKFLCVVSFQTEMTYILVWHMWAQLYSSCAPMHCMIALSVSYLSWSVLPLSSLGLPVYAMSIYLTRCHLFNIFTVDSVRTKTHDFSTDLRMPRWSFSDHVRLLRLFASFWNYYREI